MTERRHNIQRTVFAIGLAFTICSLPATVRSAGVEYLKLDTKLTNTRSEVKVRVYVDSGDNEVHIEDVQFFAKGVDLSDPGADPTIEALHSKTFMFLPPPFPFRDEYIFTVALDTTHWPDKTEVSFYCELKLREIDGTVQNETSPEVARPVYNRHSTITDVYSPGVAFFVAEDYEAMKYARVSYRDDNEWLRDDYKKTLYEPWGGGATVHFVSSHGFCEQGFGKIFPPGNENDPVRERETIVLGQVVDPGKDISSSVKLSKDAGSPPLQFSIVGSCSIGSDSVFCIAYISQHGTPINVAVVAFTHDILDVDLSLFTSTFLANCKNGWTIWDAADKAGVVTWDDWQGYDNNTYVKIFGDEMKTLKNLYDGSKGQKTNWKTVIEESSGGPGG